jgi:hypothetical protein
MLYWLDRMVVLYELIIGLFVTEDGAVMILYLEDTRY